MTENGRVQLSLPNDDESPAKRISTPAGERLSVIMDNRASNAGETSSKRSSGRFSNRTSIFTPMRSSFGFGEPPRESLENKAFSNGGGLRGLYTTSIWSELGSVPEEKRGPMATLRGKRLFSDRGRRKRILLIIVVIVLIIIALAVGLGVGLSRGSSPSLDVPDPNQSTSNPSTSLPGTSGANPPPKDFPLGTYSMTTFLDTIQTNCTSNPDIWRCPPYTIYNTSPEQSLATFNWTISEPSSGNWVISSADNSLAALNFQNARLALLDQGKDSERYRFQVTTDKMVKPTASLTGDNVGATCYFNATTFTGFLYTKMARDYPNDRMATNGDPAHDLWPYAIRAEEVISAGEGIPNCYRDDNWERIENGATQSIGAGDGGNLCSCLYKNWRTPS
ncbi:hypothetical protein P152DRAFT_476325 [Eremomyces bilateralis CBS 781.70]|uniref:Tat pathway signal sequence n=1 Tax=Eremomyces bilateralis CBS 781.70 TaxID=1392243 RepID=A0A6G1FVJ8_9PEZI|nr:uncharacterized protein P152DRAFT_476325 [Eremomyces bilateralis CBS 781.70]KAF1809669.1 hypothetical protein P152DRAFT_476325 [Eremomyces bilateralis CBS 781.70]